MAGTGMDSPLVDPMKALYWSAVINGVVAVPAMVRLMSITSKQEVMGKFISGIKTRWFGWGGVAVFSFSVLMVLANMAPQIFRLCVKK